jgi:hypothetical protein
MLQLQSDHQQVVYDRLTRLTLYFSRYSGTKRIALEHLAKQDDISMLLKELVKRINGIIPGFNWQVVQKDPECGLGLMVR